MKLTLPNILGLIGGILTIIFLIYYNTTFERTQKVADRPRQDLLREAEEIAALMERANRNHIPHDHPEVVAIRERQAKLERDTAAYLKTKKP